MKKAIIFAVIFGVISGVVNFVLETLLNVDSAIVFSIITTAFVLVGFSLGIWTKDKNNK